MKNESFGKIKPCPYCCSSSLGLAEAGSSFTKLWVVRCNACNSKGPESTSQMIAVCNWNLRRTTPYPAIKELDLTGGDSMHG